MQLLIHIMRKLGRYNITAEKLKEVAQDSKRSIRGPEKLEEMEEMLKVRRLEERFERGEVGMIFSYRRMMVDEWLLTAYRWNRHSLC